jgi:hypothetical protein
VALFLGGILPWAQGTDPSGHAVSYTPQEALAEGYIMIVLALALAVIAWIRLLVESTSRTVQLVPIAMAVVALAMWSGADRTSLLRLAEWTSGGGSGAQTIWRLVTLGAIAAMVAGTIWLDRTRPADIKEATRGLIAEWKPSRVGTVEALLAGALGFVGAALGAILTIAALGPNGAIFAVFVTLFGMAAGISAGLGIARWFRGGAERSQDAPDVTSSKSKIAVTPVERRRS